MTDQNTPAPADAEYLIRKGAYYYRPNAQGYTPDVAQAGRYSLEDAIRYSHPNGPDGPRDGIDYMPAPADLASLLTKAVGDITAALIMAGKEDKIHDWTLPYIVAINAHDAKAAPADLVEAVAKAIEIAFVEKTMHHPVSRMTVRLMAWLPAHLAQAAIAAHNAHMASDGVVQGDLVKPNLNHELSALYNHQDNDSRQFTRHQMEVAISHGWSLCFSDVQKQAAHRRAAAGISTPRDMATAPKDGTFILLVGGKTDENDYLGECGVDCSRPVVAHWNDSEWGGFWAFCFWDGGWRSSYKNPTGWLPLPSTTATPQPDPRDAELAELREALKPFADCVDQIGVDEPDEEWAKFRLLVKDYRRAGTALANSEGKVS